MKRTLLLFAALCPLPAGISIAADVAVTAVKTPAGGLQPEVISDAGGNLHLLYFKGDPQSGDLFYAKRPANGSGFQPAVKVNSRPGAAAAIGTIRGGHLAIGKEGAVHVAWMGSRRTFSDPDDHQTAPMLYTRSIDGGKSFAPERNVVTRAFGLDGGGSLAADALGNVHVVWHAPKRPDAEGEMKRTVWITSSKDNGTTFSAEREVWGEDTGVCGCCNLRAFATPKGDTYILYRAATNLTERGMYLLKAGASQSGLRFAGAAVSSWNLQRCPMSSASFALGPNRVGAAWESEDKVFFSVVSTGSGGARIGPIENPKRGRMIHKHPSIAFDKDGNILLAWTVSRGWGSAGTAVWRVFRPDGEPTDQFGEQAGVPPWSKAAAVFRPGQGFLVFY